MLYVNGGFMYLALLVNSLNHVYLFISYYTVIIELSLIPPTHQYINSPSSLSTALPLRILLLHPLIIQPPRLLPTQRPILTLRIHQHITVLARAVPRRRDRAAGAGAHEPAAGVVFHAREGVEGGVAG